MLTPAVQLITAGRMQQTPAALSDAQHEATFSVSEIVTQPGVTSCPPRGFGIRGRRPFSFGEDLMLHRME